MAIKKHGYNESIKTHFCQSINCHGFGKAKIWTNLILLLPQLLRKILASKVAKK